jgi:hypothetical protein
MTKRQFFASNRGNPFEIDPILRIEEVHEKMKRRSSIDVTTQKKTKKK